jgi:hypothetical protein
MQLVFKRLDDRHYETLITRSDGVRYLVRGIGHMAAIPHDLAHFAIERALGIQRGFWGSVAEGAVFASLTHVSGRRRPHAAERSDQILKRNRDDLNATEILVGLFNQAMEEGLGPESPELRRRLQRYVWTPPGREPRRFTEPEVESACAGWHEMLELWRNLEVGGSVELEWPEAGARATASSRRR